MGYANGRRADCRASAAERGDVPGVGVARSAPARGGEARACGRSVKERSDRQQASDIGLRETAHVVRQGQAPRHARFGDLIAQLARVGRQDRPQRVAGGLVGED